MNLQEALEQVRTNIHKKHYCYEQRGTVAYADYKVDMYYMAPQDLNIEIVGE